MEETSFSIEEFEGHRVGRFGSPLVAVAETGSTNLDALDKAELSATEGTVVVADHQRSGRGRWGREWLGVPGASLMFSIVLRPEGDASLITTALGVAAAEGIEALTGLPCKIKWPNDIEIDGKKVAGTLVESRSGAGRIQALVAGMGVNVTLEAEDFPEVLRGRATSIGIELLKRGERFPPSREQLLAAILIAFETRYPVDPAVIVSDAMARSSVLGGEVTVTNSDGSTITGIATRLLNDGALELSTPDGTVAVAAGEISSLRPA